ncbi:PTS transporter subunit IIC, partial [Mycoplasmopsis bovis]|uniref:PTS transporter subunit IIC n=1 Tax=Mycoplasmopsis bovis TaxID=28903 RepID=UPI003D285932
MFLIAHLMILHLFHQLVQRLLRTLIFSGLLLGVYWGVASSATIKGTDAVTQNAGFAVGHQQMFGAAIAYKIGKYFGKAEQSSENRKMPKGLKVFED